MNINIPKQINEKVAPKVRYTQISVGPNRAQRRANALRNKNARRQALRVQQGHG